MPLIIPSNTITGGYEVDNSLRFDDGSSDYLTFTPASNGNRKVFTVSVWVKRANLGINSNIIGSSDSGFGNGFFIQFQSGDNLRVGFQDPNQFKATNRLFRDVSAWYHIVVAVDVTQASNSDKIKIYVNGVQETSFSTDDTITNADKNWNNTQAHSVGRSGAYNSQYFDGYLAEVVNIDGTQNSVTDFGEFDADSGIWKPIDVSGLTFGTNGFYLDFENSGSLGADVSGNGNNFTVNNLTSIDQTTDTPTNNFCTLNSLDYYNTAPSNGNLTYGSSNGKIRSTFTLPKSGKWYWEAKLNNSRFYSGLIKSQKVFSTSTTITSNAGSDYYTLERQSTINSFYNASTSATSLGSASVSSGDVMAFAYDADTRKFWIGYGDGTGSQTWYSSGNPVAGTNQLTTLTDDDYNIFTYDNSSLYGTNWNFGNPAFTISSGNSDANGYGNFEYSVPSGYYALNTKNLAEYG